MYKHAHILHVYRYLFLLISNSIMNAQFDISLKRMRWTKIDMEGRVSVCCVSLINIWNTKFRIEILYIRAWASSTMCGSGTLCWREVIPPSWPWTCSHLGTNYFLERYWGEICTNIEYFETSHSCKRSCIRPYMLQTFSASIFWGGHFETVYNVRNERGSNVFEMFCLFLLLWHDMSGLLCFPLWVIASWLSFRRNFARLFSFQEDIIVVLSSCRVWEALCLGCP